MPPNRSIVSLDTPYLHRARELDFTEIEVQRRTRDAAPTVPIRANVSLGALEASVSIESAPPPPAPGVNCVGIAINIDPFRHQLAQIQKENTRFANALRAVLRTDVERMQEAARALCRAQRFSTNAFARVKPLRIELGLGSTAIQKIELPRLSLPLLRLPKPLFGENH